MEEKKKVEFQSFNVIFYPKYVSGEREARLSSSYAADRQRFTDRISRTGQILHNHLLDRIQKIKNNSISCNMMDNVS